MTITNRDGLIAATIASQKIPWAKLGTRVTIASVPFSVFEVAGSPGAGTLAGTSTTAGVVPDNTTAGCPKINAFTGGNLGEISQFLAGSTVLGRIRIYDMLFKAGAYSFNSNVTLSAQPSYSARVPGGTDYTGTQIWVETVTAFTGNMSIAVTYTNDAGTPGRTTGTVATGVAPTLGRMIQLPLQAGDSGVQKIESVVATVATVGTFNILVLRPLLKSRIGLANSSDLQGPDRTGLVQVFATTALFMSVTNDSTALGVPEVEIVIGNG